MRVRLLALVSAVALFVVVAAPAHAGTDGTQSQGFSYLALGDSVPFGFNPNPALWPNAANFIGYPEVVADRLHLQDVNASCPGEATGGFLSLTGTDNSCRPYRASFPLHVNYTGTQMAFAIAYLKSHPRTRLVTLTLGANDLFRWQKDCAVTPQPFGTCPLGFFGVLGVMQANLNTIFANIRATGYTGLIIAVTYYALDYRDTSVAVLLNGPMVAAATSHGAFIASGLEAWRATAMAAGGSSCSAGLLLPAFPPGSAGCDVHPTPLGRDLLAGAVINAVATSCPANSAVACLDKDND